MKPLLAILFVLYTLTGVGQHQETTLIEATDLLIAEQDARLKADTTYVIKILNNEQFLEQMTDGGGQLKGYFYNGQLVKIIEWIGLSSCVNITEYYLGGNQLVYAYTQGKETKYVDSTATFNSMVQTVTMECTYYYNNGKVIKSTYEGSTRCSGPPTADWSTNYLRRFDQYLKLLAAK